MISKSNKKYSIKELFPDNKYTETCIEVKKRIAKMLSIDDVTLIKIIYKKTVIKDDVNFESLSPSPDDYITAYISSGLNKSAKSPSSSSKITHESSNPDISPVTSQPAKPQPDVPPTNSSSIPNPPPSDNLPPPAETDLFKDPLDVSNLQPQLSSMKSGPSVNIPGFPDNHDFHIPQKQTNPSNISTRPHQHDLSFPGMPTLESSISSSGTFNSPSGSLTPQPVPENYNPPSGTLTPKPVPENYVPPVPENFSPQIPENFSPQIPTNLVPPSVPEHFTPQIPANLTPPSVPEHFSPQVPENFSPQVPDMINHPTPQPQIAAPSEENINNLIELGFTKEQAADALSMTGNNVDQAAELLFTQGQVQIQPQQPPPQQIPQKEPPTQPLQQIPQQELPIQPPKQSTTQPPRQPPEQLQSTISPEPSNGANENANNSTEENQPNESFQNEETNAENQSNESFQNEETNAENQSNESFQNEETNVQEEEFSNYSNFPGYTATTDEPTELTFNITSDNSFAPPPAQATFSPNCYSFVPRSTLVSTNKSDSNLPPSLANFSAPQPISSSITQVVPPEQQNIAEIMHSMMSKNQMGMPSTTLPGSALFRTMGSEMGSEMRIESGMSEHGFGSQPISSPSSNYGTMASSFAGSSNFGMGGFSQPRPQSNSILNSLPANEKSDIETLMREFPNTQPQEIIEIYNVCEKNINNTRDCLKAG